LAVQMPNNGSIQQPCAPCKNFRRFGDHPNSGLSVSSDGRVCAREVTSERTWASSVRVNGGLQ
jgi:hypothetical protein